MFAESLKSLASEIFTTSMGAFIEKVAADKNVREMVMKRSEDVMNSPLSPRSSVLKEIPSSILELLKNKEESEPKLAELLKKDENFAQAALVTTGSKDTKEITNTLREVFESIERANDISTEQYKVFGPLFETFKKSVQANQISQKDTSPILSKIEANTSLTVEKLDKLSGLSNQSNTEPPSQNKPQENKEAPTPGSEKESSKKEDTRTLTFKEQFMKDIRDSVKVSLESNNILTPTGIASTIKEVFTNSASILISSADRKVKEVLAQKAKDFLVSNKTVSNFVSSAKENISRFFGEDVSKESTSSRTQSNSNTDTKSTSQSNSNTESKTTTSQSDLKNETNSVEANQTTILSKIEDNLATSKEDTSKTSETLERIHETLSKNSNENTETSSFASKTKSEESEREQQGISNRIEEKENSLLSQIHETLKTESKSASSQLVKAGASSILDKAKGAVLGALGAAGGIKGKALGAILGSGAIGTGLGAAISKAGSLANYLPKSFNMGGFTSGASTTANTASKVSTALSTASKVGPAIAAGSSALGSAALPLLGVLGAGSAGVALGSSVVNPLLEKGITAATGKENSLGTFLGDIFKSDAEKQLDASNAVFAAKQNSRMITPVKTISESSERVSKSLMQKEKMVAKETAASQQPVIIQQNVSSSNGTGNSTSGTQIVGQKTVRNTESTYERVQMQDFWSRSF